jgi:hypothetical protein
VVECMHCRQLAEALGEAGSQGAQCYLNAAACGTSSAGRLSLRARLHDYVVDHLGDKDGGAMLSRGVRGRTSYPFGRGPMDSYNASNFILILLPSIANTLAFTW